MIVKNIKTREQARDFAIEWQHTTMQESMTLAEVCDWHNTFEELAAKFDLTDEFKENGII